MHPIEEVLRRSRALVDDSQRRILRSIHSEWEALRVIESTLARIQHSRELLGRSSGPAIGIFPHVAFQSGFITPTAPRSAACMESDNVCTRRERLFQNLSDAVMTHSAAVIQVAELAGWKQTLLVVTAGEHVSQTRHEMQSANEELETHIREHGCREIGADQNWRVSAGLA